MTIEELAAHDAADRRRVHDKAITDTRRQIDQRRAAHGPVDALERHLARLVNGSR